MCRDDLDPANLVFFLLHPTHYEVIPVPPRRPEMLGCLFMSLSLAWQLSTAALRMRRPAIMPAIFALLAFGSKETTIICRRCSITWCETPTVIRCRVVQ